MPPVPPDTEFSSDNSPFSKKKKGKGSFKDGAENIEALRSMPVSADVERAALSCMLKSPNELIGESVENMTEEYFYIPANLTIYQTLLDLYKVGSEIDAIILNQTLADRGLIDSVGGPSAISELLDDVPTTAFFEHYVEILKEKFILRRVIQGCTKSITEAYDSPEEVIDLLDGVEKTIFAIREDAEKKGSILSMREHVLDAVGKIEEMFENRGENTNGLSTGFKNVDEFLNGMHGGEMIVIAARPAMGKTSFAMNIVENVAIDAAEPLPVAVFSLEMGADSLVQRLLCSRAEVEMQKLRGGFLSQQRDFPRLMDAANKLGQSQIFIDDTPGLTIMELRAKARRLKKAHDIQLIAIDYLQLLRSPSRKSQDSRQIEIAEISSGIKGLAKELDIPIIVLAQLNRNPDSRGGGKPKMSDLRESGSIEQDADVVALLVREEYYAEDEDAREETQGRAELIIAKQRNGPTGEAKLSFVKQWMKFGDRAYEDESDGF